MYVCMYAITYEYACLNDSIYVCMYVYICIYIYRLGMYTSASTEVCNVCMGTNKTLVYVWV